MDPLLLMSATELAARIRTGELTSREVVEAHVRRIAAVNPRLNAVVRDRFDAARAEADRADRRRQKRGPDRLGPLHGVPCTIKESVGLEGMPHSGGLWARRHVIANRTATAAARLQAAGAIPLGVTNVSELCMWMEAHNRVYGRTVNAHDPDRIAGGSSGGEGAIVGAGGSPFGLGSDIGGSIRMPAFFNGVFGHKPTGGLVPGTGQFPTPEGDARRYFTTGPLCRRAADLMPILRILAGPDGRDLGCRRFALGDPSGVDLSSLDVLQVADNGVTPVSAELRAAQRRVVDALRARGARIHYPRLDALKRSLFIWSSMLSAAGGASYRELLGEGEPIAVGVELLRSLWGGSRFTLPSLGLALVEELPKRFPSNRSAFVKLGEALRDELAGLLGSRGVMLYPSYSRVAPRHREPLLRPVDWIYTALINVLELPATQVPLGLNAGGVPLGVQVVARHGNDHLTIAVAMALEQELGGWVPPRD
jgi:fatty acid amide hydrolase 2